MQKFLYSAWLLYLLAALLLLTFFLPDLIGPLPAVLIGSLVIGVALFVYNNWSRQPDPDNPSAKNDERPPGSDQTP